MCSKPRPALVPHQTHPSRECRPAGSCTIMHLKLYTSLVQSHSHCVGTRKESSRSTAEGAKTVQPCSQNSVYHSASHNTYCRQPGGWRWTQNSTAAVAVALPGRQHGAAHEGTGVAKQPLMPDSSAGVDHTVLVLLLQMLQPLQSEYVDRRFDGTKVGAPAVGVGTSTRVGVWSDDSTTSNLFPLSLLCQLACRGSASLPCRLVVNGCRASRS